MPDHVFGTRCFSFYLLFFKWYYIYLSQFYIQSLQRDTPVIVGLDCSSHSVLFASFFPKPLATSVSQKPESSFSTVLSHKVLRVGDAGGQPVLELLLSCHLCHLILLRMVQPAVGVVAVEAIAAWRELFAQFFFFFKLNTSSFS